MIEDNLEKFKDCHCYVKLCLFLSIFCAPHLGMSAKAKSYFNKAKELQEGEAKRGGNPTCFQEVYNAVAASGVEAKWLLEKWPLCEIRNI